MLHDQRYFYKMRSLGKRKNSERADEEQNESRHAKRAAIKSASAGNTQELSQNVNHASSGLQTAAGAGIGKKRAAEPDSDSFQGVATHSGIRQPEPKQAASVSHNDFGESPIACCLSTRK